MCWASCLSPVVLVAGMWFLPETPYWLVENRREDEARRSLQWYRGAQYDIQQELQEIIDKKREKDAIGQKSRTICQTLKTLASPTFLRPFSCAGVLYLAAQWTGISTMVFYMTNIFQESGSSIDPWLAPIIVGVIRYYKVIR